MILKQNNLMVGLESGNKAIEEGEYNAKIKNVTLKLDQVTQYGFKNVLQIEVEIDLMVIKVTKKTSYFVSDYVNSRFFEFLNDMNIDISDETFDVDTLVGKEVVVTIKNSQFNGTLYSNIDRIVAK